MPWRIAIQARVSVCAFFSIAISGRVFRDSVTMTRVIKQPREEGHFHIERMAR